MERRNAWRTPVALMLFIALLIGGWTWRQRAGSAAGSSPTAAKAAGAGATLPHAPSVPALAEAGREAPIVVTGEVRVVTTDPSGLDSGGTTPAAGVDVVFTNATGEQIAQIADELTLE